MSIQKKRGNQEKDKGSDTAAKVIVAVNSSKDVPKAALIWALTHVVQPGDCITLLVVVPSQNSGRKWGFPRFAGDCASGHKRTLTGTASEQRFDLKDSCSQMILQLHDVYDPNKINVKIKVIPGSPCGAVAAEANISQANWVVLDKHLKDEVKRCMEELQCNIAVMKKSQPKVLRLNLVGSAKKELETACLLPSESDKISMNDPLETIRGPTVTPTSSPELGTPFTATEAGTSSVSSSDPGTSPFFISEINGELRKEESIPENEEHDTSSSDTENETMSPSYLGFQPWMANICDPCHRSSQQIQEGSRRYSDRNHTSSTEAMLKKFSKFDRESSKGVSCRSDIDFSGNVREAVSLSRNLPPGPPPLCSICQYKAPVFGKPPRWFTYAELELATGGFSQAYFLAEGGFGSVHRGILPDGQAVAVKQHKLASFQGDHEFCSEVEVLSCAQHRNVVLLIGFCIEDKRRLLVYEYICNGSLDSHLYGCHREPLEWSARQKIAVGAARGLRYLHEECRVGCIVHRDMRPNNILITHDFEPLVGDFGLARWQPDGDREVETRVIGTFGYLAPEYAQSGQITEKADVYAFGVILIELVTGRKAIDINKPKGQQCLTEWARPLLEEYSVDKLIDPKLEDNYSVPEVHCMLHAASLCIRGDPHSRPRMSQVLRILEGDVVMDSAYMSPNGYDVGSRSARMWSDQQQHLQHYSNSLMNETLEGRLTKKLSLDSSARSSFREGDKGRRTSYDNDM